MNIGYCNVRHHSDGRVFNDPFLKLKSIKEAVRVIVSAELLFGTQVEVDPDEEDVPHRRVVLTTRVLGTTDVVNLRFYKDCTIATRLFGLVQEFVPHKAISVGGEKGISNIEAAVWSRQLGTRASILASWLSQQKIVVPSTINEGDLLVALELFLEGNSPETISELL